VELRPVPAQHETAFRKPPTGIGIVCRRVHRRTILRGNARIVFSVGLGLRYTFLVCRFRISLVIKDLYLTEFGY
jgi:hypothetical protein